MDCGKMLNLGTGDMIFVMKWHKKRIENFWMNRDFMLNLARKPYLTEFFHYEEDFT